MWNPFKNFQIKRKRAILDKDPIIGPALSVIRSCHNDTDRGFGARFSEQSRIAIGQNLMKELLEIVESSDSFAVNREKLAAAVGRYTKAQVLLLPCREEQPDDPTGLRGQPGVTGELKAHLETYAATNLKFREILHVLDEATPEYVFHACDMERCLYKLYVDVFDSVRRSMGDANPNDSKDWLQPFIVSMCAWEEDKIREELGLERVWKPDDRLRGAMFLAGVIGGERYPDLDL